MTSPRSDQPVVAVLGPTNTGKTHLAIERMLAHGSGMIGLPLRLLAREVYDKVVKAKGERAAALITGEEKIAPESARYFICTVEAMPLERRVDFLAVDEIQLAADPDRGHVFTSRILHARGAGETMLLGSDTMRPMLRRLQVSCEVQRRERLSTLSYAGHTKLTKLPKRSAIVAFSSEEVYAIAELMRRQRGGAAVIMGALSPRTRNAQAELYQSGEVDFLVATDAIGMGLNMDVDHVAFAARAKFDGRRQRLLRADEIAQIAGRAGRFRRDGEFGETGRCPPIEEDVIERIEGHTFEPVEAVEWRSHALDFSSVSNLLRSLETPPPGPGLLRVRGASDEDALRRLSEDDDLKGLVRSEASVRRLWDACLLPDFRKVTPDEHARLVGQFARHLLSRTGRLPQDWIARELASLDRTEGDLDTLQNRLAHVRTWTYAANRADWLDDAAHWREQARMVEDKLSDTLHQQLTLRFIDRRTSALVRGLRRDELMPAEVAADGVVQVEGHFVGRLEGLAFLPDPLAAGREGKAVREAALKALGPEVTRRLRAVAADADEAFTLERDGSVRRAGVVLARLAPGPDILAPALQLQGGEAGDPRSRRQALERLERWLAAYLRRELAPLFVWREIVSEGFGSGAVRGVLFLLGEQGGALCRRMHYAAVSRLTAVDRAALRDLGVRLGRFSVFAPRLVHPDAAALHRLLLQTAGEPVFAPARRSVHARTSPGLAWRAYAAAGFHPLGGVAVRLDRLERLSKSLPKGKAAASVPAEAANLLGLAPTELPALLKALGFRCVRTPEGEEQWRAPGPPRPPPNRIVNPNSPFAVLLGGLEPDGAA